MCSKCKGGRTTDVLCSTYVCPLRMERTEEEEKEEKKKNKLASISPLNPQISHCRVQTFFRFSTYHHWMPASNAQSALLTSSPDVYRHQSGTGNKDCRPETRVLYLTKVPASVGTKDNPLGIGSMRQKPQTSCPFLITARDSNPFHWKQYALGHLGMRCNTIPCMSWDHTGHVRNWYVLHST